MTSLGAGGVGTWPVQPLCELVIALNLGCADSSTMTFDKCSMDIRTMPCQIFADFLVPLIRGMHQGRAAIIGHQVDIGFEGNERLSDCKIAIAGSNDQRRVLVLVAHIHIITQLLDHIPHRIHQVIFWFRGLQQVGVVVLCSELHNHFSEAGFPAKQCL